MRNQLVLAIYIAITLLSLPNVNYGQTPHLGTAADFVLFSSVGAIGNTGISQITGNIGTNSGAITAFGNVNGVVHNADAATTQAKIDLQAAWYYLDTLHPTSTHGPVFGSGETLYKGVDTVAAAGSIAGVLTLDAQGDSNAVFIIKTGGALTTAASATIKLTNGALACNVFWVAEGAISMATLTIMRGTLISHNGAIDMGDGGTIEGRALSTTGAVSVYGTLAYIPLGCARPILTGPLAPTLGTAACYALFSSNGMNSNSGTTYVTGDVATNQGSTTGYNQSFVTGAVHPAPDSYTAQCASDLMNIYTYLNTLPYDIELLYPAQFGNKLVLTPHTYRMNAAVTFTDTVSLDAQGNVDAIFVFQVNGALSTSTYSKVKLINGTQSKNVYWKVEGAVSINDNSIFCGTIVCRNGSIILNTGVTLAGRALTTAGTLTATAITANNSFGGYCATLPIKLLSFAGACDKQNVVLKWSTATETNNSYFTVERSIEEINWQMIGTVEGAGNSSSLRTYSLIDRLPGQAISYYRLKQTDFDGNNKYGLVVTVEKCDGGTAESLTPYPNPSDGKFVLLFTGDRSQVYSTEILNSIGEKIYEAIGFQSKFDLSNKPRGVYFVQIHLPSKTVNLQIVVGK